MVETAGNKIVYIEDYRLKEQISNQDILPTGQFLSRKLFGLGKKYIQRSESNQCCLKWSGSYGDLAIEIKMWPSGTTSIHWQNPREEERWYMDESKRNKVEFGIIASKVPLSRIGWTIIPLVALGGEVLASATLAFNENSNPLWRRGKFPEGPRELPIRGISQIDPVRSSVVGFRSLSGAIDTLTEFKTMVVGSDSFTK
ncbi:MAG: hypothetical protein Q7R31_03610 [Candidatus Levybacteria bacterium]|nr:hypothetical protein [Candidatus Levybacteria bacterium]